MRLNRRNVLVAIAVVIAATMYLFLNFLGAKLRGQDPMDLAERMVESGIDFHKAVKSATEENEPPPDVELVELRGHVRSTSSAAIAGAKIKAWHGEHDWHVKTGERGEYVLPGPQGRVRLRVEAAGYADTYTEGMLPGELDVHLVRAVTLRGNFVDANGRGLFGAYVTATGGRIDRTSTTRHGGGFVFDDLAPGRYTILAKHKRWVGKVATPFELGPGEAAEDVLITGEPAFWISGEVTIASTGEPCEEGFAQALIDGRSFANGMIDDGRLTIKGALPGKYLIELHCDGYPRYQAGRVEVVDRDLDGHPWRIPVGHTIRLRVVDSKNDPIQGALVNVSERAGGETDYRGTLDLSGFKDGQYFIRVEKPPSLQAQRWLTLRGEDVSLKIVLQ